MTQDIFAKNGGVRVSHVQEPPIFAKKKLQQPGLSHSLEEIPRGIKKYIVYFFFIFFLCNSLLVMFCIDTFVCRYS